MKNNNKTKIVDTRVLTANEKTNVGDVRGIFLYTKKFDYIISYIKVPYFSIDLLPKEEKKEITNTLTANINGDHKGFTYKSFPREIDLDSYKADIKEVYHSEFSDIGRKHILKEMLNQAVEISSSGENYEHQHFLILWQKISKDRIESEKQLQQRVDDFCSNYKSVGIKVDVIKDQEILRVCNLYGNSMQAPYETIGSIIMESTLNIIE